METALLDQLMVVVGTSILTGVVSAVGTVGAIRVHISYLREGLQRAHNRIDDVEQRIRDGKA